MRIDLRAAFLAFLLISAWAGAVAANTDVPKAPSERAMDDLRWLATALEAHSTDLDGLYAEPSARTEGDVADLDAALKD